MNIPFIQKSSINYKPEPLDKKVLKRCIKGLNAEIRYELDIYNKVKLLVIKRDIKNLMRAKLYV